MGTIQTLSNKYIEIMAGDRNGKDNLDVYFFVDRDPNITKKKIEENYNIRFIKAAYELSEIPGLYDEHKFKSNRTSNQNGVFQFMTAITSGLGENISKVGKMADDIIQKYEIRDNNSQFRSLSPSFPDFCVKAFRALPKEKRKQAFNYIMQELVEKPQKQSTPEFWDKYDEREKEEDIKAKERAEYIEQQKKKWEEDKKAGKELDPSDNPKYLRPYEKKHLPIPSGSISLDPRLFAEIIQEYCEEKGFSYEQAKACLQGFINDPKKLEKGSGLVQRLVKAKEADIDENGKSNRKNTLERFLDVSSKEGKDEAKKILRDFHNDSTALVKRRTAVKSLKGMEN